MKTKSGEELRLVIQLSESGDPIASFVVADSITVCRMGPNIPVAIVSLIAIYYLVDLHYPIDFAQTLGLLQHSCLGLNFPEKERKTGFTTVLEIL